MRKTKQEKVLYGTTLSDGIAIGKGHHLQDPCLEPIPEFSIPVSEAELEVQRYRDAISSSRNELENLQMLVAAEGSADEAHSILDVHIQMLADPFMTTQIEDAIRTRLQNTETVFRAAISQYETQFSKEKDTYFNQRLIDVRDVSQRILWHLRPKHKRELETISANSILFCKEIVPSDAVEALRRKAAGFVTHSGGATSHTALIAKSRGLPYVAGIDLKEFEDIDVTKVIIDGIEGKVILNPTKETLDHYKTLKKERSDAFARLKSECTLESKTKDGTLIDVMANIERLDDVGLVRDVGAAGIGLFRSEYLFLEEESAMSEMRQTDVYQKILDKVDGLPVVFRLFDVGADKDFHPAGVPQPNPALSCRAIRFLLTRPDILRIQLRALMRASGDRELRILLPLISDSQEVSKVREILYAEKARMDKNHVTTPETIFIGAMMEVPSAIIMADQLVRECDFFSIGTNDLTQYSLAIDRSDPTMQKNFQPAHPSILRMIERVAKASKHQTIPLSLCGDLAADAKMTELLIGLGVRKLSCPPRYVPYIKKSVENVTLDQAEKLAEKALQASTFEEIEELLHSEGK